MNKDGLIEQLYSRYYGSLMVIACSYTRDKAAAEDLDKACLLSLSNTIRYVRGENKFLDEDTVLAEEYFVTLIKKKEKSNDQ